MKEEIIQKLNTLNSEFYNSVAEYFDNSRQYYWDGWEILINKSKVKSHNPEKLKVFDAGCGNGRFYGFLSERLENNFSYIGIDSNRYLLEKAEEKYKSSKFKDQRSNDIKFENVDLVNNEINFASKFNLIASFAVFHHIPSFNKRLELVNKLKELLDENGIIVISFWNFLDDKRLLNKLADWSEININKNEIEEGDYLLDWERGTRALRYCHYFSEEEIDKLVAKSELKLLDKFKADGKSGNLNTYIIITK